MDTTDSLKPLGPVSSVFVGSPAVSKCNYMAQISEGGGDLESAIILKFSALLCITPEWFFCEEFSLLSRVTKVLALHGGVENFKMI